MMSNQLLTCHNYPWPHFLARPVVRDGVVKYGRFLTKMWALGRGATNWHNYSLCYCFRFFNENVCDKSTILLRLIRSNMLQLYLECNMLKLYSECDSADTQCCVNDTFSLSCCWDIIVIIMIFSIFLRCVFSVLSCRPMMCIFKSDSIVIVFVLCLFCLYIYRVGQMKRGHSTFSRISTKDNNTMILCALQGQCIRNMSVSMRFSNFISCIGAIWRRLSNSNQHCSITASWAYNKPVASTNENSERL